LQLLFFIVVNKISIYLSISEVTTLRRYTNLFIILLFLLSSSQEE